jgi:glycosyltransferase involved in cell wall biosynthesis
MTGAAILVVTTVHAADDTRIRERLIRSLESVGSITYATREPGPTDRSGIVWVPLRGGRFSRNLNALRLMLDKKWRLVILHDPETIPAGALTHLMRHRPIVFDVHEDLPAQVVNKEWAPIWARPILRWLAKILYALAQRSLVLTLAEPGYQVLFTGDRHPVFPNYPRTTAYPDAEASGDGSAVYLGDLTRSRGIEDALIACGAVGVPLTAVGRVNEDFAKVLRNQARSAEVTLTLTGRLPSPEALRTAGEASVGLSPLRDIANYRNSLPTKTLEYLAMGVPVVATDLPGTREVLSGLEAVWLVPPQDPEAMAQAITEASRAEAKEAALSQVGLVRERFQWPETEVRKFYLDLVGRSETPTPS